MNENIKQFIVYYLFYRLCGQVCSLFGMPGLFPNAVSGICFMFFSRAILAEDKRQSFTITTGLILFTIAFFFLTQYLTFWLGQLFHGYSPYFDQEIKQSPFLVKIAVVGFISPAAEEILFRRFLYQGLKPMGLKKASLASSIVFGLCHGNAVQGIYSALWGMALCFLYEKHQDLRIPMMIHMLGNLLSLTPILRLSLVDSYFTVCLTLICAFVVCMTVKKKGEWL